MSQLIVLILSIVYFGGVWKFWRGFRRTNFSHSLSNKLVLSIFWPVLCLTNRSYRKNFQKALKG